MHAFEVYLNGKKLCTAGIGNDGVITAVVDSVVGPGRSHLELAVGGLITPSGEYVKWIDRNLRVGDQIKVKVLSRESVDTPKKRYRPDLVKQLRYQRQQVRKMARELGWTVVVRGKR